MPILEPPKPPYDPVVTVKKGINSSLVSLLMVALVAAVTAAVSDRELMAALPPWATPLFTFAATSLINWWKNRDNPSAMQYTTPPLAR